MLQLTKDLGFTLQTPGAVIHDPYTHAIHGTPPLVLTPHAIPIMLIGPDHLEYCLSELSLHT